MLRRIFHDPRRFVSHSTMDNVPVSVTAYQVAPVLCASMSSVRGIEHKVVEVTFLDAEQCDLGREPE